MSQSSKISMKELLSEGLYEMMKTKPFEKITIKQICDKTGVIRGTFYNHFLDKYEALEYLITRMLMDDSIQNSQDKITHVFQVLDEQKDFFYKVFQIQGQNGFESMMQNIFKNSFLEAYRSRSFSNPYFNAEYMANYQATVLCFIMNDYLKHGCKESSELLIQRTNYLMSHSIVDILQVNPPD